MTDCPDCGYLRDVRKYRVLGITVRTQVRDYPSTIQLILDDLGVPCEHQNCEPFHKYRLWGLVLPACPSIDCLYLSGNTDDYTDTIAARVRQLAAEDPELGARLHDTVVRKHDFQTFRRTIEDLTGKPMRSGPSTSDSEP